MLEKYLKINKIHFRCFLSPHLFLSVLLLLASPLLMGIQNLDAVLTARVLEFYVGGILGIILFIPVLLPFQDLNIRELITSKRESILCLQIIFWLQAFVLLLLLLSIYLLVLKGGNCDFPVGQFFFGTLANCILLGGLGLLTFSVSNNIAAAYMVPIFYYILNYGAGRRYLGKLYLFSMSNGGFEEKYYLMGVGMILMTAALLYRWDNKKLLSNFAKR